VCLEVILVLERLSEDSVVVNLSVDGQVDVSILADKGLSSTVCTEKI